MINAIIAEDLVDHDFVDAYTTGYEELVEHVRPFTPGVGRAHHPGARGGYPRRRPHLRNDRRRPVSNGATRWT